MDRARSYHSSALLLLLLLLPFIGGCDRTPAPAPAGPDDLPARIDASLASAARFLVARQGSDGAWRSKVYGPLRDGPSLTPHVLACLYFLPGDEARAAFHRGNAYLNSLLDDRGEVRELLQYPVYDAAEASWLAVLENRTPEARTAQAAWLRYVRARQLTADLGWGPDDPEFGGWGYAVDVPRKPPGGRERGPLVESNISATVFGLGALRCANVAPDDPAYRDVLTFVEKCQNFAADAARADAAFDDGGFFFVPGDAAKNKAGPAGADRFGTQRFHSYGSATADGLRCLLHAGLPPNHPRVLAARAWLERNFSAETNPGTWEPDRRVLQGAAYYYYCWSAAHAFMHLGASEIQTAAGKVRWNRALAAALLGRQRPDGSWSNRYTDTKEDDPLVATPFAAAALAACRKTLAEEAGAPFTLCHHLPP